MSTYVPQQHPSTWVRPTTRYLRTPRPLSTYAWDDTDADADTTSDKVTVTTSDTATAPDTDTDFYTAAYKATHATSAPRSPATSRV